MGILSRMIALNELQINGQNVDDEDDFTSEEDNDEEENATEGVENNTEDETENTPTDTANQEAENAGNEDEDNYTLEDDDDTTDGDQPDETEAEDTEGTEAADTTGGNTDDGNDDAEDDFTTDGASDSGEAEEGQGEEGQQQKSQPSDPSDSVDDQDVREAEKQIYDSLTDDQKRIRILQLKVDFKDLYDTITTRIRIINDIPKTGENIETIKRLIMFLTKAKNILIDFIENNFDKNPYIENYTIYIKYLAIFRTTAKVLEELNTDNK